MKRFFLVAALLGISSVPALASERAPQRSGRQPVALSDQQLDSVKGGDLLGGLTSTLGTTLNTLTGTVNGLAGGLLGSGSAGAIGGTTGGLLGNGNLLQPVNGLLNTATGLLNNLGL